MIKKIWKDKRGFGVKEMAVSLGFIVVVGLVITAMSGKLGTWLDDIWSMVKSFIDKNIGS